MENSNKKIFEFHFEGGEPTHWPQLSEYAKFLKENFNCLISMHSNGSKKIEYWQSIAPYFDSVTLSGHHEFMEQEHFRNLGDFLYENNVLVSANIMMHPTRWDTCMHIVDFLINSKHKWAIRYREIYGSNVVYTPEQISILARHRVRSHNLFWFIKNNKYFNSKVRVVDSTGKKHKLVDNEITLKRLNQFKGWRCSVGVDFIHINRSGVFACLSKQSFFPPGINFYSDNFTNEFSPVLEYVVCNKDNCWDHGESNMKKYKTSDSKIIPIYPHV
jgi:organic radical activating enzyme